MKNLRNPIAVTAALAWISVPVMWSISRVLDRSQPWEDSPVVFYILGTVLLMAAGVLSLLAMVRETSEGRRSRLSRAGLGVLGLAVVASFIAWAIPLWAIIYGVAMTLLAVAHREVRRPAMLIAGGMGASLVALVILTVLKVGRPDSFGDYPVAWTTAFIVAALTAAAGMLVLSQHSTRRAM